MDAIGSRVRVFLPLLFGGVVFGGAVPGYETPPGHFYNYVADCTLSSDYWPMIFSSEGVWGNYEMRGCVDEPLLLLNEPERAEQANDTPTEGAALLYEWREWPGELYCCGTQYGGPGWDWFGEMQTVYSDTYGLPLPIDGIHFHVYPVSVAALDTERLAQWRGLATENGWELVVSEIGLLPVAGNTPDVIAEALPDLVHTVTGIVQPTALFWFAWSISPEANTPGIDWANLSLYDGNSAQTVVGEAWSAMLKEWGFICTKSHTKR